MTVSSQEKRSDQQHFYRQIGNAIRLARDKKQFTQEYVARRVGLSRTSLTNIERGRQKLLLHTFVEIVVALETTPSALLPSNLQSPAPLEAKLTTGLSHKDREFVERVLTTEESNEQSPTVLHKKKG